MRKFNSSGIGERGSHTRGVMKRLAWPVAAATYLMLAAPAIAGNVSTGTWLSSTTTPPQLAAPPQGIEGYCLGISGDRIYMTHGDRRGIGDSSDVSIYDISSNTWSAGTSSPNIRAEGAGTSFGGLVYCMGGRVNGVTSSLVEVYSPTSDSWTTLAPMEVARAGFQVAPMGGKLYAVGGRPVADGPCSGPPITPGQAEVYDIPSNTWSFIADPPVPVTDAALVSKGGLLYLIGGCTSPGTVTNALQIYDPQTNTWSAGPNMPTPRASLAAAALGDTIYAIAGIDFTFGNLSVVEGFDVAHASWVSPLTPKPTPSSEIEAAARGISIYIPGSGSFGVSEDIFEAFKRH